MPRADRTMHLVLVSDFESTGGAALAASRLAAGLSGAGVRVTRIVAYPDRAEHPWATLSLGSSDPRILVRVTRRLGGSRVRNRIDRATARRALDATLARLEPDAINIHNLHGAGGIAWTPEILEVCNRHAPTFWTLHDMWSFTGRCAFSMDCDRFRRGCDESCPTPAEYPALEPGLIAPAWRHRRSLLSRCTAVAAVSPSRWLAGLASAGLWAGHRVEVIPNGVPLDAYRPVERRVAREALGIEGGGPFLLVVAQKLGQQRKTAPLAATLATFGRAPFTLLAMGAGRLDVGGNRVDVRHLGYIHDDRMKALVYSAADAVVYPSTMDNLPNVVLESIACGTPVVAFAVGGIPEVVRPGITGWLASEASPRGLAGCLEHALADLRRCGIRQSCRATAVAEYGDALQADRERELAASVSRPRRSDAPERAAPSYPRSGVPTDCRRAVSPGIVTGTNRS
jgi:glycosyltransferase involved in cell wall biosynthesis